MFTGALGLHYGLEKIGATVVPTSSGNTVKQLKFMRDFQTDAIVATPSYCLYLAEAAHESADEFPMSSYNVRLGLLGSEGCTPEMRAQIEERWGNGFFVTDNYGMSELNGPGMSGECIYRDGLHICEDHFLCEIIDPKTGAPLDKGETGELVVTNLTKRGLPMLRYRTKDITYINYEPCACGRTSARMHKVIGRSDDMLKIRGVNVFPSQIESALIGIRQISPHYQLVVTREGYADALEVRVELVDGSLLTRYGELEALQRGIHNKIKAILGHRDQGLAGRAENDRALCRQGAARGRSKERGQITNGKEAVARQRSSCTRFIRSRRDGGLLLPRHPEHGNHRGGHQIRRNLFRMGAQRKGRL